MRWWFRQQLFIQIFICILIGIGLGFILGEKVSIIKPIGDIFIRLLKMLIVPLTFFTLINGITKMENLRSLRSVGGMTLLYYIVTTFFASVIGIFVAILINPGKNAIGLLDEGKIGTTQDFNLLENIVNWVPTNPIEAMASANMLQVIVFSIIIGVGLLALGEKVSKINNIIKEGSDLMIKITEFVMQLAPYGILALIANMVGTLGSKMLSEVGRFILTDTIAVILILILIYPTMLQLLTKLNPFRFYRNIAPAMLVAASTTSSSATLPISMGIASNKLGTPERIFGFTLPLGATINMDGMAAAIGVIAVFSANLYNISITPILIFQFVFLGLALSIGTAGIKGGGIVMSTVLLQTLNLPLTLIPILAAVWPIIDISHTTCNVTGDLAGTTIIGSKLKLLNRKVFNS
jgi:Na+/H+-dicarboxylate symporter